MCINTDNSFLIKSRLAIVLFISLALFNCDTSNKINIKQTKTLSNNVPKTVNNKSLYIYEAPPFINTPNSGVLIDIIQALGVDRDYSITFVPSKRARESFANNNSSIMIGSRLSAPSRINIELYILPLVKVAYGFIGKQDITNSTIKNHLIGIHRGLKDKSELVPKKYVKQWEYIEVETSRQGFDLLEHGRIDYFLADFNEFLKNPGYKFHSIDELRLEAGLLSYNKSDLDKISSKLSREEVNKIIKNYFNNDTYLKYILTKPLKVETKTAKL